MKPGLLLCVENIDFGSVRYVNVIELYTVQEYLSLMYASEDPGEIFSENTEYIRLVVYAGFMAVIYKVLWSD